MSAKSTSNRCAICEKEVVEIYRPFCSKRCADVDLNRWLKGSYAIPGEEDESGADFDTEEPTQHLH
ncbi:DNA gyrase inhibitor YacG [Parvularcula sp. IMCC14364]|uniref:DNA gyrase inhibitor YacG n=1 Tax=Parvularcula sp. IMCC14364 TaxID=3067902 RepID=UPI0027420892|nr:DNA gyrase inhibitor YacG [Parvularcula sp. IMCC14364]